MSSSAPRSTKRTVRILGGLIGLFVVGLLVNWWILASDNPVVNLPNPVLPNPNAYDFYVAASNAIVNAKQISDATMKNPVVGSRTPEQERALQRTEAAVRKNAPAFQLLHQGFAYEYGTPSTPIYSPPFPQYAAFRNFTRLLFAQSRVRAARGDWGGATESALDGIQLGEEIQHGGNLIANLVGDACESLGQRPMWETVEHLNAAQSRTAAQRLQAIMDRHFPYADTMQVEKRQGQATLKLIFHGVTLRAALETADNLDPDNTFSRTQRFRTALYLLYGKKLMLRNYTAYMDQISVQARRSYGLHLPPPPQPEDPYNSLMLVPYKNARLHDVETETQNGLLLVTLALRAFRLENGHYPTALTELAPAYLKRLPDDPFAAQGTFKYRIQGQSYTLYSVGPDGKDDGGTPINDPKYVGLASEQRYNVKSGTLGDIVAGINFP